MGTAAPDVTGRRGRGPLHEEDVVTTPQDPSGPTAEERDAERNAARIEHDNELADEWGEESFPASDPPAHY